MFRLPIFILVACSVLLLSESCKLPSTKKKGNDISQTEEIEIDYKAVGMRQLQGSTSIHEILCQTWDFKEDLDDVKGLSITSELNFPFRSFCFFDDGTVVKDPRSIIRIGKWTLNEKQRPITITCDFGNGEEEVWQLARLTAYEMILSSGEGANKQNHILVADGVRHINIMDDPFYVSNVLWRIKPKAPESEEAIKQRFKDYLHFYVLFYRQKINTAAKNVSFIGLPTCYDWRAGQIVLPSKGLVSNKWINCFYNNDQAMQAYDIADKLIGKNLEPPHNTYNWVKINGSLLEQMEKQVDLVK